MATSSEMSVEHGEPESDPELFETTDGGRNDSSQTSVDGVDSVGVCPSPRRFASTDTATNPGLRGYKSDAGVT